jgi:hypothetical protein
VFYSFLVAFGFIIFLFGFLLFNIFFRLSILPVFLLAYFSRETDILGSMSVNKQMLKASKFGCLTKIGHHISKTL